MKKILFFGEGIALSHIVRPLWLARQINEEYEVAFACASMYKKFIKPGEIYFDIPSLTPADFFESQVFKQSPFHKDALRAYVEAEEKIIKEYKPDVVVGDMRISLAISAKKLGVPYVCIGNAYWSPYSIQKFKLGDSSDSPIPAFVGTKLATIIYTKAMPKVERAYTRDYNIVRMENGMAPVAGMREMHIGGDINLYLDIPSLSPTANNPSNYTYMGPITGFLDIDTPEWIDELGSDNKPIIYFSFGSTGNKKFLNIILDILKNIDATVVVATANKISADELPKNFYSTAYVPALKILEKADLMICNGGSGSIYQAASKGKPIIGFCSNMDQFLAMEMVEKHKIGRQFTKFNLNKKDIKKSVFSMIEDDVWKSNVANIANEIKQYDAVKIFKQYIEQI